MDHSDTEFVHRGQNSGHTNTNTTFFENSGSVGSQIGVQNVAGSVYTSYHFNYGSNATRQESGMNDDVSREDAAILESLAFPEMLDRRSNIDRAHPTTCEWIFEMKEFKNWVELPNAGLLWIKGKPGSGKSTLMNVIYDKIKDNRDSSDAVCLDFFFSARGVVLQHSPVGMLRSLINQIFWKAEVVRSLVRSVYREKCAAFGYSSAGWEWKQADLEQLFVRCVLNTTSSSKAVDIFIDALDEAGEANARVMARYFHDLNQHVTKMNNSISSRMKICISCRHYPIPTNIRGLEIWVEHHNAADIRSFVHDRLSLGNNNDSTISDLDDKPNDIGQWQDIEQEVVVRANGIFQWVHLVLLLLEEAISEGESRDFIREQLRQVPEKLEQVYEHIIRNIIKAKNRSQSYLLFQLICFAERPLSLLDIRFAMAANALAPATAHTQRCHETKNFVDSDRRTEQRILVLSGGLIDVIKPQTAVTPSPFWPYGLGRLHFALLAHETVKEYLLESGLPLLHSLTTDEISSKAVALVSPEVLSPTSIVAHCHSVLYWICLLYVRSISTVVRVPDDSARESFDDDKTYIFDQISADENQFWFSQYAAAHMLSHAEKAKGSHARDIARESELLLAVAQFWVGEFLAFNDIMRYKKPYRTFNKDTTALHMAAYAGLLDIIRHLVQLNGGIDAVDEQGFTPLHLAASRGHLETVDTLHNAGADLLVETLDGITPLVLAARGGHVSVVEWLLARGAGIEPKSKSSNSALSEAVALGQSLVARVLLDAGADVNLMSGVLGAALTVASSNGDNTMVSMLIDAGADVNNFSGPHYGTALKGASSKGREATVPLLLEAGADVNIVDGGKYDTALIAASFGGHEKAVSQLLKAGADVNIISDDPFTTALMQASLDGHVEIVSMLLSAGAKPNLVTAYPGTALIAASSFRYDTIVSLLLDAGAETNLVSGDKTALLAASIRGTETTVSMLINAGSDVNFVGGKYGTSLIGASSRSRTWAAYREVEEGIAGFSKNEGGGSYFSTDRENIAIISKLLKAGAQVNLVAGKYGTALIAASKAQDLSAIKCLLEAGAEVNLVAGKYGTALAAASYGEWDRPDIVLELLAAGAEVNLVGGKYRTALAAASIRGHDHIIEQLLKAGAR